MTEATAVFIQANNSQLIGAKVAKFAIETRGGSQRRGIAVSILNVDDLPIFQEFEGVRYMRGSEWRTHDLNDLQSFTLSRFMPPQLMEFSGRALVIDPDVFAVSDLSDLFLWDFSGFPVAACPRKGGGWDSSVMLLDCAKLCHWRITDILLGLKNHSINYDNLIRLRMETGVQSLPRTWNSLDALGATTKMLHTTERSTQPWKTGLPINFRRAGLSPLWGLLPLEPLRLLFDPGPSHYRPHPRRNVEATFFALLRDALDHGAISDADISSALAAN